MGLTIQLAKYPLAALVDMTRWWGILLHGLVSGMLGLLVYGLICAVLKVEEMTDLASSLKRRFIKLKSIPEVAKEGEIT